MEDSDVPHSNHKVTQDTRHKTQDTNQIMAAFVLMSKEAMAELKASVQATLAYIQGLEKTGYCVKWNSPPYYHLMDILTYLRLQVFAEPNKWKTCASEKETRQFEVVCGWHGTLLAIARRIRKADKLWPGPTGDVSRE